MLTLKMLALKTTFISFKIIKEIISFRNTINKIHSHIDLNTEIVLSGMYIIILISSKLVITLAMIRRRIVRTSKTEATRCSHRKKKAIKGRTKISTLRHNSRMSIST